MQRSDTPWNHLFLRRFFEVFFFASAARSLWISASFPRLFLRRFRSPRELPTTSAALLAAAAIRRRRRFILEDMLAEGAGVEAAGAGTLDPAEVEDPGVVDPASFADCRWGEVRREDEEPAAFLPRGAEANQELVAAVKGLWNLTVFIGSFCDEDDEPAEDDADGTERPEGADAAIPSEPIGPSRRSCFNLD